MFRELTYEELDFVSGGKPPEPPVEPPLPAPDIEISTTDNTITVTASTDGGFGTIEWNLPTWDLSTLTIGMTEGGDTGSITWDAGDGEITGTYSHDFGDATVTAEIFTGGQHGPGALVRISLTY